MKASAMALLGAAVLAVSALPQQASAFVAGTPSLARVSGDRGSSSPSTVVPRMAASVAGTVGETGIERISGSDKEGLLDVNRLERAQKGPEIKLPEDQKLKVGIIGGGLAGMITAMDLSEAGHQVEIFEARPFMGGKVGSWKDKGGNHIEMGLHVFFGCYYNFFGIFRRLGIFESALRLKTHNHTFVNKGGTLGGLDFRMGGIGAPFNGLKAFATTGQLGIYDKLANALALGTSPIVKALFNFDWAMEDVRALDKMTFSEWFEGKGGSRGSIKRLWDPIAYALGFIDCDNISARCMLTIFQLFAIRSEASVLRMLEGSPDEFIHQPILKYLGERGVKHETSRRVLDIRHEVDADGKPTHVNGFVVAGGGKEEEYREFDVVVAATDVPGIKKLLPENFRKYDMFDNIYKLDGVPVATVQLRFDGWVTELNDKERRNDVASDYSGGKAPGLDNLLYTADAEFSCFADLALTSPTDYYKPGEGTLLQCVMTPGDKWMPKSTDDIAAACLEQALELFPSARELNCTWTNVVKLGQSLYREGPGLDQYRPDQRTPIPNFFMAGSYTYQDYIDSMEGATKSALLCADRILEDTPALAKASKERNAGHLDGKLYYVNHVTKETQWERPAAAAPRPPPATMQPPPGTMVQQQQQQQQQEQYAQPAMPVVVMAGGSAPPPAYSGAVAHQGRTPVACHTTFWVAAGLSWIIWMFGVSAATAKRWFCDDDIGCAGITAMEDACEEYPEHPACDPRQGLVISQLIATVVISIAVIPFTVAFFRPFDADRFSSKMLGFWGGVLMVVYVVLQTIAFACGIVLINEINDDPRIGIDGFLGETFDVAVSGAVFGLIQAIVVFALFRRAGDGPAVGSCCSANGLPIRTPRVQQPTKQQYAAGT
eukprot:g17830.t1